MDYRALNDRQRETMLHAVGAPSMRDLFIDVEPQYLLEQGAFDSIGDPMEEMELSSHLRGLASTNLPASKEISFLGGGTYDHYIPSIVDHVLRKPELFTAYTPYQPEVSQGTLQAIFEYQTAVCELTGMEVSNAGMYDGATASVEALLMAARITKRHKVLVSDTIHPEWQQTIRTYCDLGVVEVVFSAPDDIEATLDDSFACLLVANPDFLGRLCDLKAYRDISERSGALLVVAVNPLLQAVVETPGTYGADIVVGEGQALGLPMSFGGPGIGLFACKQSHIRQMPGRLCGRAKDADGKDGFVLTLSTREQHIRRERATSNICSNQSLCSIAIGVYLAALGREGVRATARRCIANAHYLHARLLETGIFETIDDAPFGYEFALRYTPEAGADAFLCRMKAAGILAGINASTLQASYPASTIIFAATEKRTRGEMDYFASEVASTCL